MTNPSRYTIAAALLALALAACNAADGDKQNPAAATPSISIAPDGATAPGVTAASSDIAAYDKRLSAIESAIGAWGSAPDIGAAHRAAEAARNLVVGPAGPYYGDADGDGTVAGASGQGLLPGRKGEPGIASAGLNACIDRDVRGGEWSDPGERWAILDRAIRTWSPANNPFPSLPSHPQRIVGWASLALDTQDLDRVHEFAGHARLHADVSRKAQASCR